ncbi:sulfur carrier protein ThiS [Crocinitomix algicola]|uniref:sulfur carrier protein ThiS n=1 Tax=Crocinitomix algicola TaxID=1740263 RepID=UPI0008729178|nr:sulfur carrier protein ThiS [Crocinitomix algicola]
MKIELNNTVHEVNEETTVQQVLEKEGFLNRTGIAAAVNQEIISKTNWATHQLKENDKILIITATAGG